MRTPIAHKVPLSSDHLAAAVVFATLARDLERGTRKPIVLHVRSEHQAASMACVFSSVAYLEAEINEFFADAADENMADGAASAPVVLERLRKVWKTGLGKTTVLDKYDIALALCDLPVFDKGAQPYQTVALLIRLRNALTHFVPEWQPGGGGPHEDSDLTALSRSLRPCFSENPLAPSHDPYFPQRCLGYGASKWAVDQGVAFVTEFLRRLGVGFTPSYILESISKL